MPIAGPGCRPTGMEQAVDVRDPAAVHRQDLPPTNGWGDLIGNGTVVPMRHCGKKIATGCEPICSRCHTSFIQNNLALTFQQLNTGSPLFE